MGPTFPSLLHSCGVGNSKHDGRWVEPGNEKDVGIWGAGGQSLHCEEALAEAPAEHIALEFLFVKGHGPNC